RFLLKLQTAFFRFGPHNFAGIFFPAAAVQIGLIENLNIRQFRQRFVKRPTLVRIDRANEKCDVVRQSAAENCAELFQWLQHISGFPFYIVGKKIRAFEPNQLAAAEKWKCLQRGDGRANRGGGAIHVVGRTIDYLESKFARLGRSELFGQFRRFTLYPRFVGTDDRANVLGRCFGFGHDPLSSQTRARSASDTIANWKRSEERRVGKEGRSGRSPEQQKK